MFKTLIRFLNPNPFEKKLKKIAQRKGRKILLGWNRGLGDIPLLLYAMILKIREVIPDAEITFLTRENLAPGFALLDQVEVLSVPHWQRGAFASLKKALGEFGKHPKDFDLVIEKPDPKQWMKWQIGTVVPKLRWNAAWDPLYQNFSWNDEDTYVGVQPLTETNHSFWRDWSLERWDALFRLLGAKKNVKIVLFGFHQEPTFSHPNLIDLRGKTSFFELFSIIKNKISFMVLPDSGILSILYYLDLSFPIRVVSLWADCQGIMKQNVPSPNPQLIHCPLWATQGALDTIAPLDVYKALFPAKPFLYCPHQKEVSPLPVQNCGAILLAGGQGSRLGLGPKGLISIGGKTLFEWILEKAPQRHFPIAIMISPVNYDQIMEFFQKHSFFDREIYCFQQEMLPVLDEKKKELSWKAPNGNGSLFYSFKKAGLLEIFRRKGVDLVTLNFIDNPLSNPADPCLLTYHRQQRADVVLKCVKREVPNESMGALIDRFGIEIVEYTALDTQMDYQYSNTGMMSVTIDFMDQISQITLPLYWVKKQMHQKWIWKQESFIFDALPFSHRVRALCYDRQDCYAPLKNIDNIQLIEKFLKLH